MPTGSKRSRIDARATSPLTPPVVLILLAFQRYLVEGIATSRRSPFRWACIDRLFSASDAAELARSFPTDHYMTIPVEDVERPYSYEARSFLKLGRASVSYPHGLTPAWQRLGDVLLPD